MDEENADTWLRRALAWSEHPLARTAVPIMVMAVAIVVLHRLSGDVHLGEVRADLHATPASDIALAILFTLLSFAALSLNDVIAVRVVAPGDIPARIAALASATGYALSNLLGFSYLTGMAVRYRVYADYGLDVTRIAALLALAWCAFWSGLLLLIGGLLVFHPSGLAAVLPVPPGLETGIGLLLIAFLAGLLAFVAFGPRELSMLGTRMAMPDLSKAVALTAVSLADIAASSLTLYVLLPPDLAANFAAFFVVYVVAIGLGILSHAPGGIGVFEATILGGLGAAGRSDALAALLIYRVIYTGLPFLVATVGLTGTVLIGKRREIGDAARAAHRFARPFVPLLSAAVAMAAGAVLLLSGAVPAIGTRLEALRGVLPLGVVEASHLIGSIAGVLLLVLARGLYRRLYRAWAFTLLLLAIGFVVSLTKGIGVEEAFAMLAAAGILVTFRDSFYRVGGSQAFRPGPGWLAGVAVLFAALTWVGFLAFRHVEYRDALWWHVSWPGEASRFLRASLAAAVVLAAFALNAVIGVRVRRHTPEPIPGAVRALLAKAEESEANLALLGDKSFLLDTGERAFLAYADTGAALMTKGDPVGDEAAARDLLWEFREMADREGKRAVFYGMTPRFLPTFLDMGLSVVKFGEVGKVDLETFSLDVPAMKDFRQARNRAAREGYRFEIVPARDVPAILDQARAVSDAWLAKKQGREKGFAMGSFDESYLSNFDMAVLRAPETGAVVAFANLLKGGSDEISVDLMRHAPDGPGFAMDALFGELMLWSKAQGFRRFNLGAAPFAGSETRALASGWQRLGGLIYQHGEDIYHFEGLRAFKEKFRPVWTPNYIATRPGLGVARAFVDANALISGGLAGLVRKGAA